VCDHMTFAQNWANSGESSEFSMLPTSSLIIIAAVDGVVGFG
jgi:hypothetical protein